MLVAIIVIITTTTVTAQFKQLILKPKWMESTNNSNRSNIFSFLQDIRIRLGVYVNIDLDHDVAWRYICYNYWLIDDINADSLSFLFRLIVVCNRYDHQKNTSNSAQFQFQLQFLLPSFFLRLLYLGCCCSNFDK